MTAAPVYFQYGRRGGRTLATIARLKDGQTVAVSSEAAATHMRHELQRAGKDVRVIVQPPAADPTQPHRPPMRFYDDVVDQCYRDIFDRARRRITEAKT